MGTNYYLRTKSKKLAQQLSDHYTLVDEPDWGYEIHVGKLSCGWVPLAEKQIGFSTFKQLKFVVMQNIDKIDIYDEYGDRYSWPAFEDEFVSHANVEPKPYKWVYEHNPVFNAPGKKSLDLKLCDPEEAEIWSPFRHDEYTTSEYKAGVKFGVYDYGYSEEYTRDPDIKCDWTEGEFS